MIHRRKFIRGCVILFATVSSRLVTAAADENWSARFQALMKEIPLQNLVAKLEPSSISSSKKNLLMRSSPETTPGAALDLWIADEKDHLLLTWYRETSREKRAFISALFLCHRIEVLREPLDGRRTDFELSPMRFRAAEAAERLEELEYVKSNARALAKEFHAVLAKVLPAEKVAGFAYTAGLGDREYERLLDEAAKVLAEELSRKKANQ
jgi:hypothetical protein